MSIFLAPSFDRFTPEDVAGVDPSKLDELIGALAVRPLGNGITTSVKEARGSDGATYVDVEFIVTARWRVGGDLFVSGSGFYLNLSALIRGIKELLSSTS